MKCRECQSLCRDMLDGVVAARVERGVRAHLEGCGVCRAYFAGEQRRKREWPELLSGVAAGLEVPVDTAERVASALRGARGGDKAGRRGRDGMRRWLKIAAMLPLLLVAGGVVKKFWSSGVVELADTAEEGGGECSVCSAQCSDGPDRSDGADGAGTGLELELGAPRAGTEGIGGGAVNILLIMADDLTVTALGCYGNKVCLTPNINRLAARGMRFKNAFCNALYCGPSRVSMLSGYYPHATGAFRFEEVRSVIGERATWPQHFKGGGYHTARVSKIFQMPVPSAIASGADGVDDVESWCERFNSQGPEWQAVGRGELLEGNPDGSLPVVEGNLLVMVEADGDDMVHSDGKTAAKAVELLGSYAGGGPFFLGVGFVRPHVPFVAPRSYFEMYKPYSNMELPVKLEGGWQDIPVAGVSAKNSISMEMSILQQQKALAAYYAAVSFMDTQVGRVLDALERSGAADNTLVIFTSDHGFHLGEHDFWARSSLRDECVRVPLIISGPGVEVGVCEALVELVDLYPTTASLCGLDVPEYVQGRDFSLLLSEPGGRVRDEVFCVAPVRGGFMMRDERYSYIQYQEDGMGGVELYDVAKDPGQYTNLAYVDEFSAVVGYYAGRLQVKLAEVKGGCGAAVHSTAE